MTPNNYFPDGMILIDPDYAADGKKIYATLLAAFRYGREDLDVLGLQFRKDLFSSSMQVYPPDVTYKDKPLSRLQERLKKKLGEHAYPFWFEVKLSLRQICYCLKLI